MIVHIARATTGLLVLAGTCVVGTIQASASTDITFGTGRVAIGSGRLVPSLAAAVGLIGAILGAVALTRSTGGPARRAAMAAGMAGLLSVAVGGLHAANAAGGIGTGNGLAGAIVAVVVGLIAMLLSWLALTRSRRVSVN